MPLKWRNNLNYISFAEYAHISVREAEEFFNQIYMEKYLFLKFQIKCPRCNHECSINEDSKLIFECSNCGEEFNWNDYIEDSNYIYSANMDLLEIRERKEKSKSPIDLFKEKMKKSRNGIKIFISYAHEDEKYKDKLIKHLSSLKRRNIIEEWHDRKILAGQNLDDKISDNLLDADIILLMISVDFLNSDYCYEKEMTKALEMNRENSARVIPIIVRYCDWHDSPFSNLNALPRDGRCIKDWPDEDQAYMNIIDGIKAVIEDINRQRP